MSILSRFLPLLSRRKPTSEEVARIRGLPDRVAMAQDYIPAFADLGGRILWVGCRDYTAADYEPLEARGGEVWTTDISRSAARWGRPGRHRTGDVCGVDALFRDVMFDGVVCNGVLGWGVDAPEQQARALKALAAVMRPGGLMLLGWNTDKIADPIAAGLAAPWFAPSAIGDQPPRRTFDGSTHVYDGLRRL